MNGVDIEVEEAITLFDAKDLELHALCATANELRKRTVGDMVTFVTVRNINFTNICYTGCKFCAFAKHFGDEEGETLSIEQVADRGRRGLGGLELLKSACRADCTPR